MDRFWAGRLPPIRKGTRWDQILQTLVTYRLLDPGSEWRLHREWFLNSAMADLLGADFSLAEIHQLYEVHDQLLEHKEALFVSIRPIFHQREERIEAHIFMAFLAYCLPVTLRRRLRDLAPGLTPRAVLEKFAAVQMLDVHLPTHDGREALPFPLHPPRAGTPNAHRRFAVITPSPSATPNHHPWPLHRMTRCSADLFNPCVLFQ